MSPLCPRRRGRGGKAAVPGKAGMAASARAALPDAGMYAGRLSLAECRSGVVLVPARESGIGFSAPMDMVRGALQASAWMESGRISAAATSSCTHARVRRVTEPRPPCPAETVRNGRAGHRPLGWRDRRRHHRESLHDRGAVAPHLVRVMFLTAVRRTRSLTRSGPSTRPGYSFTSSAATSTSTTRGRAEPDVHPQRPARALGVDGIERQWRTVLALGQLCAPPAPARLGRRPHHRSETVSRPPEARFPWVAHGAAPLE